METKPFGASVFTVLVLCVTLAGCSTLAGPGQDSWSYNPQNYQGCTVGQYDNPERDVRVRWWDCKDKAHVTGAVDLSGDGVPDFNYTASDVTGSTAAKIRADVEKAFARAGVEVVPDVVQNIVDAIMGGAAP